nr:hypothetical protein [Methylacidiphilum caldifontis]
MGSPGCFGLLCAGGIGGFSVWRLSIKRLDELGWLWSGIEKKLYEESQPTGASLVLYDLSSVYFEGDGPAGLAQYGYSRDHRQDRLQVLLAVATDSRGIPIHVEVLRGNRADSTTLTGLLITLRRRFGIQEATLVFDGGDEEPVEPGDTDRPGTQVRDSGNSGEVAGDYQKSSRRSPALAYGSDSDSGDRTAGSSLCYCRRGVASTTG